MAITYKKSGVNYSLLDPAKLLAQKAAETTSLNLKNSTFREVPASRGESAYVIESSDCYYASVSEGLGTKNLIADRVRKLTEKTYYDVLAQDTVAMIVNDLITVGAKPLLVNAYWAVGDSNWFKDKKRTRDLVNGWKKACDKANCVWGGGETPVLKDIVNPEAIDLAGSAFGIIKPKKRLILGDKIQEGDDIIFLESNGIHANGLTLAGKILDKSKNKKYLGKLLLTPTHIYAKVIDEILDSGIDLHYLVNITGHGFRKLMRAKNSFTYEINDTGKIPNVFKILKKETQLSDKEMYSTFNMGAGFAVYADPEYSKQIIYLSQKNGVRAWIAGKVLKGKKQINIVPLKISYNADDLNIRNKNG